MLTMPSVADFLDLWETGECEHAVDRALTMLAAYTGESRAALAALGIHRRDALLVRGRMMTFGSRLAGVISCPECGCEAEIEIELDEPCEMEEGGSFERGGRTIVYRVPNSYDLAAAAQCADPDEGARVLRERCIESNGALDDADAETAEALLDAVCEPATIEVAIRCPQCGEHSKPIVDIASFHWGEIAAYASRLLDDVDALARRYAWTEREILSLPEQRRRRYVEAFA